jgi:two-component system LytT family response regulator
MARPRPIRTLIVDDEPDARERVRAILAEEDEAEVVGEAGDGVAAAQGIRELTPDLVFLDVQMPEIDGFGVLAALADDALPLVVFVTAFDRYAVRAFDVQAVDYVLKPFDRERIREAFQRARQRLRTGAGGTTPEQVAELVAAQPARRPVQRLLVKVSEGFDLVRTAQIDWAEAAGNYVTLHLGKRSAMLRQTIGGLEEQLDPGGFRRIHRSTIVNLDRVQAIRPTQTGEYCVLLEDGTRLRVGRNYRDALLSRIG